MKNRIITLITSVFFLAPFAAAAAISQPVAAFSVDDLIQLIEKNQVSTIETVLPLLPQDFRRNVTFIEHSGSLQAGDPMSPRAILWDEKGGMAISFNGAVTGQRGSNTFEILQSDGKTDRLHYYEMSFPLQKDSNGRIHANLDEPNSCRQCHGSVPRPIWQEYPSWTNNYGSQDDFSPDQEGKDYLSFVAQARKDPRFHNILPAEADSDWHFPFPYRPDSIARPNYLPTAFAYRPNLRFGNFMSRLNAHRLFSMIRENPSYRDKREDLLSQLMNCGGPSVHPTGPPMLQDFGLTAQDLDIRNHYDDPKNIELDFGMSYFDGTATVLEYLTAIMLDDLVKDEPGLARIYSTATLRQKYGVDSLRNLTDWPLFDVLDSMGKWFPLPYIKNDFTVKIQKRMPYFGFYEAQYEAVCSSLHASPVQAILVQRPSKTQDESPGSSVLHARCVYCHGAKNSVLNLTDTDSLKKTIQAHPQAFIDKVTQRTDPAASTDFRMPFMGDPLTPTERSSLLAYFKDLIQ